MSERTGYESLLSLHGRVLGQILEGGSYRLVDIARRLDVTERTIFSIVSELEAAHFIQRAKVGRRNEYIIQPLGWQVCDAVKALIHE